VRRGGAPCPSGEPASQTLPKDSASLGGTFDWQRIETEVTVPNTAARVSFFLGLVAQKGTIWYDDISLKVR